MLRSGRICVSSSIHHQITKLFLSFNKTWEQLAFILQVCCFQDSTQLPRFHFLHLLMCSFLILVHLNEQRADWPVSVPACAAIPFCPVFHYFKSQLTGPGGKDDREEEKKFTITVCAFQRANIPPLNPQGNKGGLLLKHCEDSIYFLLFHSNMTFLHLNAIRTEQR